jgi:hypothetical protein
MGENQSGQGTVAVWQEEASGPKLLKPSVFRSARAFSLYLWTIEPWSES